MLFSVPPTFSVWPSITSLCAEWSADTSDTLTATNGATLALCGVIPDLEAVKVTSVRAGSVPPGVVGIGLGGGFVGVVGLGDVDGGDGDGDVAVAGGAVCVEGGALAAVLVAG